MKKKPETEKNTAEAVAPESNVRSAVVATPDTASAVVATMDETPQTGLIPVSDEAGQMFDLVRTARAFPRNIGQSLAVAKALATLDTETAEECFYYLERRAAGGKIVPITGPSIRCAEIVASSWGNIRYGAKIIGIDDTGAFIRAAGFCHDLERNVMCVREVRRRITTKEGHKFGDDMIMVTGNAAASIAQRNAVFGAIPRVIINAVYNAAVDVAKGLQKPVKERWNDVVVTFSKWGVDEQMLLAKLERKSIEEIVTEDFVKLTGFRNAIRDNEITVDELFGRRQVKMPAAKDGQQTGEKPEPRRGGTPEDGRDDAAFSEHLNGLGG